MRANKTSRCIAGVLLIWVSAAWASEHSGNAPLSVVIPKDAPYLLRDGSIKIVGSAGLRDVLTEINKRFALTHPDIKFSLLLDPSGATGLGGLAADVSAFAPMDREAWPQETRPFRQIHGYEATDICIAHHGYPPVAGLSPPALCVNARNPLAGLTVAQVARIFTRGGGEGDLTHWAQLGLAGEWKERTIHLYGTRDNGGFVSALRHSQMDGLPLARRYEPLSTTADVIQAVANDPYGIGLIGSHETRALLRSVRLLPLAAKANAPFRTAERADLETGLYPLADFLHLYINLTPGQAPDHLMSEYIKLVFSPEGQGIIAASGHVPLTAQEVEGEMAKLMPPKPAL